MAKENKRLMIEIERMMRQINRDTLNPLFPEFSTDELKPIMEMTAKARASYLKELIKLSKHYSSQKKLTINLTQDLSDKRLVYEELVKATQALEIAIQRDYLDV